MWWEEWKAEWKGHGESKNQQQFREHLEQSPVCSPFCFLYKICSSFLPTPTSTSALNHLADVTTQASSQPLSQPITDPLNPPAPPTHRCSHPLTMSLSAFCAVKFSVKSIFHLGLCEYMNGKREEWQVLLWQLKFVFCGPATTLPLCPFSTLNLRLANVLSSTTTLIKYPHN